MDSTTVLCCPLHCRSTILARWLGTKTLKEMAAVVEAYCVKCKAKRNMKEAGEVTMANGRKAMKGKCPECGTGMFKIMGNKA